MGVPLPPGEPPRLMTQRERLAAHMALIDDYIELATHPTAKYDPIIQTFKGKALEAILGHYWPSHA